jgi:SynChlorMet cassette radical SAM/SPASM protein ScmE
MRTPRTVDLELTSRCNLACRYCYYLGNAGVSYKELPTECWLAFIRELGEARVMSVCLSGGEALLREDIFTLIDAVVSNQMRFSLLSNGIALTAEVARRIKQTGRCNHVQISLDGSSAEIHEIMRGKGSFAPALAAIRSLQAAEVPVTVRVTVHAGNIDDLPTTAKLLLEELKLPSFSTNSISSLGSNAKYNEDLFLSPTQHLRAMQVLADLDTKYPGCIEADAGPLANWKMFRAMRQASVSGQPIEGRGHLVGCGCIFNRIAVRADGAYVPCVMLPQLVLGFIGVNRLDEVWQNAEVLNTLRSRTVIPLDTFEDCHGCDYQLSCTGNCAGGALSLLGDANRPSPDTCLRQFERDLAKEGLTLP